MRLGKELEGGKEGSGYNVLYKYMKFSNTKEEVEREDGILESRTSM